MLQVLCNILSRTPIQKWDWKQLHLHSLVRGSPANRGHEELQRCYYLKQTRRLENKQVWKHYEIDACSSLLTNPMQLAKHPPHTLKLCIFVHGYFLICSNSHLFVKVTRVKNSCACLYVNCIYLEEAAHLQLQLVQQSSGILPYNTTSNS